jgi:hypothetical protein
MQGVQCAELQGVNKNQIWCAGWWNNDALSNCYLTYLPWEFIWSMAGFEPNGQSNYYLPRAKIQPSPGLVQAI